MDLITLCKKKIGKNSDLIRASGPKCVVDDKQNDWNHCDGLYFIKSVNMTQA